MSEPFSLTDLIASHDMIDHAIDRHLGGLFHARLGKKYRRRWGRWFWLRQLVEYVVTPFNLNSIEIAIPRHLTWNGLEAERTLWALHVPIWGRWFTTNTLTFRVMKRQARWTEYILNRYGIPTVNTPVDPKIIKWAQVRVGHPIPAWTKCATRSGNLFDRLGLSGK